ncbi:D-alanyl-lipoteichoic acid biosynthesis protein DltD [bacterium 210820-DFI.6.37]|nr:D-alanyl-lipoteichoic acid biosynthesis protein DltD [bacterium 210820-DFI.6.37]
MKKVTAFLIALALFAATVCGVHSFVDRNTRFDPHSFGSWISQYKFFAGNEIKANMNKDTILVLGSSEFRHGTKMTTHPVNLFQDNSLNMMMVGAGYYQSLFHATELASIEDGMKKRKAVLILSPQWFTKTGVLAPAYASRFSEDNFIAMLQNKKISRETKEYLLSRSKKLLKGDPKTLERVEKYERVFFDKKASFYDRSYVSLYRKFLKEKRKISIYTAARMKGVSSYDPDKTGTHRTPDWEYYDQVAEKEGKAKAGGNPFYVSDRVYEKKLKPQMEAKKDSEVNSSYAVSPEYDDLECFLRVCEETGIKPMLVLMPVNGYWYDHVGFPKEERQAYYENIRALAEKYQAELADFGQDEYTRYFFLDKVHLGWKGWLAVDESIYRFAEENENR